MTRTILQKGMLVEKGSRRGKGVKSHSYGWQVDASLPYRISPLCTNQRKENENGVLSSFFLCEKATIADRRTELAFWNSTVGKDFTVHPGETNGNNGFRWFEKSDSFAIVRLKDSIPIFPVEIRFRWNDSTCTRRKEYSKCFLTWKHPISIALRDNRRRVNDRIC